jgi:molecular chaperone GrpE
MEEQEQSTAVDTPENLEPLAGTELADLKQQNAELQDRLLRMQAEFDNFRKRTERERMEFAEYAGEMTVRALLPILDDFERALRASEGTDTELTRGIELIYSRFLDTLRKQGLEPIPAEGAQFDPHEHEAIGRVESNDHEDNTIVQEFQRGYRYKGRLLRPSMVQVAVKE